MCQETILKLDVMRIKQILINLLSNAIKFSNKYGVIKIKYNLTDIEHKKTQVEIIVEDFGLGIS